MNKQELLKALSEGKTFNYQGFISGVFSNWHPAEFKDDADVRYCCPEQYFMAKKAIFFQDDYHLERIMNTREPQKIKEYGRKVRNFDEQAWAEVSEGFMYKANALKYSQHPEIAQTLIKTGEDILVECNPADRIWGAGIDIMDRRISEPFGWPGENKLGFILMQIRKELNG